MNQIPNIEETNTREVEEMVRKIIKILSDYVQYTGDNDSLKSNLAELLHHQLQKARKENADKLYGEGYYNGVMYERERIEAIFKEHVPPHAMDLEDSVWLKRLLNKAFNHDKNI